MKGAGFGGHEPHYEGKSNSWLTPKYILDAIGPFDLDPCASDVQPMRCASRYFTEASDGLRKKWNGFVFANPPYGPHTRKWLKKLAEHGNGIALVFTRTDTKAMQEALSLCSSIVLIAGRVSFERERGGAKTNSGAPSILLGFGPKADKRLRKCDLGIFVKM